MKSNNLDLLDYLRSIVGCEYISDLRTTLYNSKAKILFEHLDLNYYPLNQIKDAIIYIYAE